MKLHLGSFAVALITALALTSTPATAQQRGGHGGGWHGGGGRVSSSGMQRGMGGGRHINSGRVNTGRTVFGRPVPRGNFRAPLNRNNAFVPSRRFYGGSRRFYGGAGFAAGVGVGVGVGAYRYPYRNGYPYRSYYPYRYGYYPYNYYPYSYSYYPNGYSYPQYYGSSSVYSDGDYVRSGYATLRLVDVPRDAEVYLDGAYAGLANNSDGVFQLLDLTPGSHQIEIRAAGFEPVVFEVRTVGGDTITYRARMTPYSP